MATATATATAAATATTDTKDATTDIKDSATDIKKDVDVDVDVDAAKDVDAQVLHSKHNHASIAGPKATASTMAPNAISRRKVTSTVPPMTTGRAAATASAMVPAADGGGQ